MEKWKDIVGYEGYYQISDSGNIKSLIGFNGKRYVNREKILSKTLTTTGYYKIELIRNKQRKSFKVHRLVAIAFIENPLNKNVVNHLDGNKLNNNIKNLEWCTTRENVLHSLKTGLKSTFYISREELEHLYIDKSFTLLEIARMKNVSINTIQRYIRKYDIKLRKIGYHKDKYNIDLDIILEEFKKGKTNKELAEKYSCKSNLIARRRYQFKKKGILL